jgi:long-chain fatty acid transport protein
MRLALALAAAFALGARTAAADDTHYHDYPLGDRAVGIGGAYAALADDPSGIFYNPAGLVNARRGSVQISTNLYGLEISDSFSGVDAIDDVDGLQRVATELNIIPTSSGFTTVVEEDTKGRPLSAYGVGSFVPSYRSLNSRKLSRLDGDEAIVGCENLGYSRSLLDRTFMFGAAAAHRFDDVWRIGVSAFLSYRTLTDNEETSCFAESAGGTAFANAESNLRLAVANVLVSLGVQADLGNGIAVGATVTSPSIRAFDFADITLQQSIADPATGESRFLYEEQRDLRADTKVGPMVRVGAAWVKPRLLTLSGDVVVHAPSRYELFTVPGDAKEIAGALTIVSDVERRAIVNFNLGAEWLVVDHFSVSGGFFSNFSTAPEIPGKRGDVFREDRLPNLDAFGGSLVLGFFGGAYTLTRIGVTLSYSEGTDVRPHVEGLGVLGQRPEFVKEDVSQLVLFVFIGSTFRY